METAGYSGTPLVRKLGIKPEFIIKIVNAPMDYKTLFTDFPNDVVINNNLNTPKDFIHIFCTSSKELKQLLPPLYNEIKPTGMIWISWPKQSAKIPTDLNGNVVREMGLHTGLVDIKVCAVNTIWSGLKFVIPVKNR